MTDENNKYTNGLVVCTLKIIPISHVILVTIFLNTSGLKLNEGHGGHGLRIFSNGLGAPSVWHIFQGRNRLCALPQKTFFFR